MKLLNYLKRFTKTFFKFLGDCFGIFFALMFHPWLVFGIMPIPSNTKVRLPLRTRFALLSLHMGLLVAGNFVPRFIAEEWFNVKTSEATAFQLGTWLCVGILCAGWAAALMSDFIEPVWTNRLMRKRMSQNTIVVPDRALDAVFNYNQDTTVIRFTRECQVWMKTNLKSAHGMVPMSMAQWFGNESKFTVWFKNPDDAFAFKMRWL